MEIRKQTIEKYTRFLNLVKQQEGKALSLPFAIKSLGVNTHTAYVAKHLGMIDFKKDRILRCHYDKAEPIVARRLVNGISDYSKGKIRMRKAKPITTAPAIKAEPIKEIKKVIAYPAKELTLPVPVVASVALTAKPTEVSATKQVRKSHKKSSFTIKIFGLPIFGIER